MARGNQGRDIYAEDRDRKLAAGEGAVAWAGWLSPRSLHL